MGYLDDIKKLVDEKKILTEKIDKDYEHLDQKEYIDALFRLHNVDKITGILQNKIYSHLDSERNYSDFINLINNKPGKKPINNEYLEKEIYRKTISKIDEQINGEKTISIDDLETPKLKEIYENLKKDHPDVNMDAIFANIKIVRERDAFGYYLRNNLSECLSAIDGKLPENLKEELGNAIKDYVPLEEKPIPETHPYEESINDIKNKSNNEQLKKDLDYLNDVLITRDYADIKEISLVAETAGAKSEKIVHLNAYNTSLKHEKVNGFLTNDSIFGDNREGIEKSNVIKEYNKLKFELSDNTKDILRRSLKKLASMKGPDGTPMFNPDAKVEESSKIYGFKNLDTISSKAIKVIKSLQNDTLTDEQRKEKEQELTDLAKKHKEAIKDYDELIGIVKEFNTNGNFPANVNVSRNETMPEKYIKDFENVSLINSIWQTLSLIHDSGMTIDEFVDDPNKGLDKFNDKYKNFGSINQYAEKHDDLDLIVLLNNDKYSTGDWKNANLARLKVNYTIFRKLSIFSHIEHDPFKNEQNQLKTSIQVKLIMSYAPAAFDTIAANFLSGTHKERIATIKNILIQDGTDKNYVACSVNLKDMVCPLTGEIIKPFDYNNYLLNGEINAGKLADKLESYKAKVAGNPEKFEETALFINAAIKETAKDLVNNRNLTNDESFEKLLDLSGTTVKEYMKGKSGSLREYANTFLRDNKTIDQSNLKTSLLCYSALKENYSKRNWFSKIFNPAARAEKKSIANMDKALTDSGITRETIDSVTNKEKTINQAVNEIYRKEAPEADKKANDIYRKKIAIDINLIKDQKTKGAKTKDKTKVKTIEKGKNAPTVSAKK